MNSKDLFTTIKCLRLSDGAAEQIAGLVREGNLAPGTRLPSEREMVELLGVSRTSYREAVRILETMGVLRVVSGRGTWVRESPACVNVDMQWVAKGQSDVSHLLEVCAALDSKAAAFAARRGTDKNIGVIRERLRDFEDALGQGDSDAIMAADTGFHMAVAKASGNNVLERAILALYESLRGAQRAITNMPGSLGRMEKEHCSLVEAILSHDVERAVHAMARHESLFEREIGHGIGISNSRERGTPSSW